MPLFYITSFLHITHADGRRRGGGLSFYLYLSDFPQDTLKTDAARITKLDVEMFHNKSWKSIYCGVKRSKKHCWRESLHFCECCVILVYSIVVWAWHFCTAPQMVFSTSLSH